MLAGWDFVWDSVLLPLTFIPLLSRASLPPASYSS